MKIRAAKKKPSNAQRSQAFDNTPIVARSDQRAVALDLARASVLLEKARGRLNRLLGYIDEQEGLSSNKELPWRVVSIKIVVDELQEMARGAASWEIRQAEIKAGLIPGRYKKLRQEIDRLGAVEDAHAAVCASLARMHLEVVEQDMCSDAPNLDQQWRSLEAAQDAYDRLMVVTKAEPAMERDARTRSNLAKGPKRAAENKKKTKAEKLQMLEDAIRPLVNRGMKNDGIVEFLKLRNLSPYSPKSTLRHVNSIAARLRKK